MGEADIERRICSVEADMKTLYDRLNKSDVSQAQTNTKLDSMLLTLGELKESVNQIKERPSSLWDKMIAGIVGAFGAGIATVILASIAR